MFIWNFKFNGNLFFKILLIILIIISIVLFAISVYNIYSSIKKDNTILVNDSDLINDPSEISTKNYTNILKQIHDNVDDYLGREIIFTGYVYRIDGIQKNQFVLARNMIINEASQSVVVGFLCESDSSSKFKDYTWVKVKGTIEKGYLNGEIPILKINSIEKVKKPKDEFVYPPDDEYIPTSMIF